MNELTDCPEMDYFMNEDKSDVVFVVEGQRLPALKILLSVRNKVFRAMFSENFKESKDKTVVIEETSFEAFKTLILFLYSDQLVLKDDNDLKLIKEVCELSDRYDSRRLLEKVGQHLKEMPFNAENLYDITLFAFNHKIDELMAKMLTYLDIFMDEIVKKDIKQLCELNDSTNDKLLELIVNNYRNLIGAECKRCEIINMNFETGSYNGNRICMFTCKVCKKKIKQYV